MPGRRFRLRQQVLATELVAGDTIAHYIPQGEIVEVIDGCPPADRLVDLRWMDRTVTVFAVDLESRAEEVRGDST